MPNPTMWFEVSGKDYPALKSFYSKLFDWELKDMDEMPYSTIDATDGGIPGGVGAAPEGHPGHVTFYVQVDDLEACLSKVESLGGKRAMEPTELPGGTSIALFTDPEGHEIGLMTQPSGS